MFDKRALIFYNSICMKAKSLALLFFTVIVFSLQACRTFSKNELPKVYITKSKSVKLLPPSSCSVTEDSSQIFSGTFANNHIDCILYTESTKENLSICILNTLGIEMGSLFFDGQNFEFDSNFFPRSFKAEYILSDFQSVYYDFDDLKENYEKAFLDFVQEKKDDFYTRKIYDKENLLQEIQFTLKENRVHEINVKNYIHGYEYKITEADE